MYSGMLRRAPFLPDETSFQHARQREEYIRRLQEKIPGEEREEKREEGLVPVREDPMKAQSLSHLLDIISPEDSALISLIVFLLCDNTENDVVLLGILLYVLLSK